MVGDTMKNRELTKNYNKTKNFVNFICNALTFILGLLFFIIPTVSNMEPNKILFIVMLLYFGIKVSEYILTRQSHDNELVWTFIACALGAASAIEYMELKPSTLVSIALGVWILIMTIIKLIKITEYRENENNLMYVNIITMSLFVMIGVLSIISIYRNIFNINLIMGFFFIINGLLCTFEVTIKILTKSPKNNKLKNKS